MAIESTSSSRCVTGKVTVTHNFEVTDFSVLDGMGIGKFVSSNTFSAGGCDWRIDLYPDGLKENESPHVSACLCLVSGTAASVSVAFSFSLLLGTKDHQVITKQLTSFTFEPAISDDSYECWGWPAFIDKPNLQEVLHLNNCRRFKIRCALTVKQPRTEDAAAMVVVPQPKLHQDLTDLLKSGEGSDVTFSVGDQLFPAHRCILATRSKVFRAELFGAMKEKDAQRIEIDDIEPAAFEALLHFVYTDSLPDDDCDCDDDNAADSIVAMQHLLVAADRYGLDRLRLLCEAKLCHDIDAQTVATTLALAEQHHCTQLRDACIGFIASLDVLGDVMKTDGYKHLIASCPSIMEEILDKIAAVWSNSSMASSNNT